jgi:hypothetical protein
LQKWRDDLRVVRIGTVGSALRREKKLAVKSGWGYRWGHGKETESGV